MPTRIIDATISTITLSFPTVDLICAISLDAMSLITSHKDVRSAFSVAFSAFNARILSSSTFICARISSLAPSFASESPARPLSVVYSGMFVSISATSCSISV